MHATTIIEKGAMNLQKRKEYYMEEFRWRKRQGEII